MKQILEAILAGDAEAFATLPVPESYTAVTVHKDEATMFEGMASRDKDPRQSLHVEEVPTPELGPGEALVAVMASSINYNTVWTSIFEPVSTFGFLERYGRTSPLAKRHDLPYHVVGSDLSGVVLRTGPGRPHLEARRRGHRALPVGGAGEPARAQRHDARPRAADLGLRDQLRRPRPARAGEVQPAAAQARAPDLGGGRGPRAGELHRLPPAGVAERRRDEAGRHRPDLGRLRAASAPTPRRWRSTAARPRSASSPRRRRPRSCKTLGAELVIDRNAEGFRFWQDEQTQDPKEWQRLGKCIRELTGGDDVDIVFEHPGRETFGAVGLRRPQGRHHRHLRLDLGLHARVRQPLPLDEPQAHRRLALRQLPRGVGGQPAGPARQGPPDAVQDVRPRRTSARRRSACTTTSTRARSACSAWRPRRASASPTPSCAPSTSTEINRFRDV